MDIIIAFLPFIFLISSLLGLLYLILSREKELDFNIYVRNVKVLACCVAFLIPIIFLSLDIYKSNLPLFISFFIGWLILIISTKKFRDYTFNKYVSKTTTEEFLRLYHSLPHQKIRIISSAFIASPILFTIFKFYAKLNLKKGIYLPIDDEIKGLIISIYLALFVAIIKRLLDLFNPEKIFQDIKRLQMNRESQTQPDNL